MTHKLYIGNLDFGIDERGLEDEFGKFGEISDITIPTVLESGKKRGFAFITFETKESTEEALSMNGKELRGRTIRVSIAEDRKGSNGRDDNKRHRIYSR